MNVEKVERPEYAITLTADEASIFRALLCISDDPRLHDMWAALCLAGVPYTYSLVDDAGSETLGAHLREAR